MSRSFFLVFAFVMTVFWSVALLWSSVDLASRLVQEFSADQTEPVVQAVWSFQPDLAVSVWSEVAVTGWHCYVDTLYESSDRRSTRRYVYLQSALPIKDGATVAWEIRDNKLARFRERYGDCTQGQIIQGVLDLEYTNDERLRRLYLEKTGRKLLGPLYLAEPVLTTMSKLRRFKWTQSIVFICFSLIAVVLFGLALVASLRTVEAEGTAE